MAAIGLRLWWVAFAVLLWSPDIHCRNVTHEDIRDAMLSLVHMFRQSEDKLERHEYREKALGDQVKKMLTGLERKHRALEPLKGMISRLDERLSNVETILLQRDEREKTTQKKTNEALEAIQKSLQSLSSSVANTLKPSKDAAVEDNLTTNDDALVRRLDTTDTKLESIKSEIENLKKALNSESLRAMCLEVGSDGNPLEKHISEAEKLLNKYELKLNEYNTNSSKSPVDIVTLNEVSLADEAWHNKMAEVMERQEKDIKKIQQLLSDAESTWKELPRMTDLNSASNQTLAAIETAKHQLKESDDLSTNKVTGKLREMGDRLATTNRDIQASLTESNTMSERVYDNITRAYHHLITEVQTLTKNENVMLRTADDVLDTKKRIEYSVHRILMELSDVIRTQTTDFNKTMNERLDVIESSILQSQSGGMTNLSAKIESEMSQVWRQIGLMAHQLNSSKILLDKLTDQTSNYVNGSSTAMDNMKDKVGAIITRMKEVDDSLNYLVGRMALVAEEFNKIKKAISQELDRAKTSFRDMNDKLDKELTSSPRNKTSAEKKD